MTVQGQAVRYCIKICVVLVLIGAYAAPMRITVDISSENMEQLLAITGEKRKSPAVAKAVDQFIKRNKAREFGILVREGSFDYPVTNDELEAEQDGH